ncbi:MAG: lipid-A-disaccharide synthase [Candidatus Melainabacteria bacterium LEY3_CP_29_8]|nr:MAG: lipid-A-disaccharide synthase [Candidatus Melainabacteria bacterium LEY3_CP_29_8]
MNKFKFGAKLKKKKIFIITGELSGDLHASCVVKELKKLNDRVEIEAIGSDNLKNQGVKLFEDHKKMSAVGLSFNILFNHIKLGKNLINYLKNDYKPDLVLLIDYGGFNLNMAKFLKKEEFTIFYYIPPQIWASRSYRINTIKKYVDKVLTIFPFENEIYEKKGIDVKYTGHPLIYEIPQIDETKEDFFARHNLEKHKKLVSIFPGSRKFELKQLFKIFIDAKKIIEESEKGNVQFVLSQANNIEDKLFNYYTKKYIKEKDIKIIKGENYHILKYSDALMLASGTVALEAALYKTPFLVAYRGPWLFYLIYLFVRSIKMVSLPNIILNKRIIKEMIQNKCNKKQIANEILKILNDNNYREHMIYDLNQVKDMLSHRNSSYEAAKCIYETLYP